MIIAGCVVSMIIFLARVYASDHPSCKDGRSYKKTQS